MALRIQLPARPTLAAACLIPALLAAGCGESEAPSTPSAPALPASVRYDAAAPLEVTRERPRSRIMGFGSRDLERIGLRVRRLEYDGAGGERVPALLATPTRERQRGCLIWENGLFSRKEDSAIAWGAAAELGLTTLSIDLREHGERAPRKTLDAALRDPLKVRELVVGSVADLRRAVDLLDGMKQCKHNIGLVGGSLGGVIGVQVAAEDERVRAVELLSVPGTWSALLRDTEDILPKVEKHPARFRRAVEILSPYDPVRFVGQIAPRPLLLLHGNKDPIVPPASAADLTSAALQPVTSITYTGKHDPFRNGVTPKVARANAAIVVDFLRRELARSGSVGSEATITSPAAPPSARP